MSNFSKNLFWAVTTLIIISVIFSFLFEKSSQPQQLSLSQLAQKINAGQVSEIAVSGDDLKIKLADGSAAASKKEAETGLSETLKNLNVNPDALQKVKLGIQDQSSFQFWVGVLVPTLLPLLVIGAIFWFMFRQARTGVNQAFSFGRSNIRLSTFGKEKVTFKDVAGLKEAKEELVEIVDFLKNPKKFLDLGARIPRGVLLMGPPGTGKTLIARAISGEASVPFFSISASEFVEMFVGVGASVSADTPVLIKSDGRIKLVPIGEFADAFYGRDDEEELKKIEGVETLGYKPLTSKFFGSRSKTKKFFSGSQWSSVSAVYRHRVKKLYKIHYRGGVIRTTGDHSIFVRSRNMIMAKKASEIRPGDILVNLPFKVRGRFIPGFGTTHAVRAHAFSGSAVEKEIEKEIDLFGDAYQEQMQNYAFVMRQRGLETQSRIAAAIGMSQSGVKDWQLGRREPRILHANVIGAGTPARLPVTKDLLKLLGYYTAEGNADRYAAHFTFGIHERALHRDCADLVKTIFKLEPSFLQKPETNSLRISIHSPFVSRFFENQCGTGSRAKHIPELLWELPKEHFLAYLDGYTRGDGYTSKDGKLSASSVSRQLIRELAWLSAMHGIQAGIRETFAPAGRIIREKPLPATRAWNLIIGKSAHPFKETAGASDQFKKPIVQKIEEEDYGGYVYDLCGCDNEAFFGGEKPVLLHNSRTRDAFATAKKAAPAILFIDEIDAVGRQRGAGLGGGNDEREQTLNQILVELDGFDRDTRVIVLAATNRPDILDPALLRPGRFDRRVVLDLPDLKDREDILKLHAQGKALAEGIDFKKLAARTPGFSGADLANLMNEGALLAARLGKKKIEEKELLEAIEKVMLGPERKTRVITQKEKEITAYHEGGHALVAASLKGADPVHKISIISRGMAGGYTMKLPLEEEHLRTRTQFLNDIAVAMAGYASEKLMFGDISTGASNDLREASEIAHKLVTKYGMSDALGPMTFGKTEELIFLGREIATEKNYSEKMAEKIDEEVKEFTERAYRAAQKILASNKQALKKIAQTLIEKETLEQEEFYNLLKPFKIKPVAV